VGYERREKGINVKSLEVFVAGKGRGGNVLPDLGASKEII